MANNTSPPKRQALEASGTFNPRFAQVRHPLFRPDGFFDPRDLLQLKYEAVRAIQAEGRPIAAASAQFGLSRPTLYQALREYQAGGLEGLFPRKRGPKGAHKLTAAVCSQLRGWAAAQPQLGAKELARRVRKKFRVNVHPRTIEKTLRGGEKRGRRTSR